MNIVARDNEELKRTISIMDDMIRRIHNSKEKDESAPFINCKPESVGGYAWVDVREMSGYYIIEPSKEDSIDNEFKKRSLDLQERFIKLMEKQSEDGDEWKKK